MNTANKQPVQAGALNEIFKLLFKGVDKLFDAAAEYQNDFGKLKQVTKVPITKDGENYTVLIKLAPVKDREHVFYVEIDDGGCPGLDFSNYHEKIMKIDNNNQAKFEEIINKIITDAGAERATSPDDNSNNYSVDCYDRDDFNEWQFEEQKGPHPTIIGVSADIIPTSTGKVKLIVKRSDGKKLKFDDHEVAPENVSDIPSNEAKDVVNKIIHDSNLVPVTDAEDEESNDAAQDQFDESDYNEQATPASSYVDVSLSYIKSSEEVRLDAIYANYDIADAMKAVEQVVDNDDFIAVLTEEPQAFRITDEGDDFDIAQISRVDTSCMNCDITNAITLLDNLLQNYYVNMDSQQQTAAYEITSVLKRGRIAFQSDDVVDDLN